MTQPERRSVPRITSRLPLLLTDDHKDIIAHTENISASGAYCTLARFLAPMTKLQIQLELPDRPKPTLIKCQGVVVRVEPTIVNPQQASYNVAILFSELSDHSRSALARYVQRHGLRSPRDSG